MYDTICFYQLDQPPFEMVKTTLLTCVSALSMLVSCLESPEVSLRPPSYDMSNGIHKT